MKEYKFKIHGNEYEVSINSVEDNIADVTVNGTQYEVEIEGKASKVSKITKPTPSTSSAATTAEVISTAKAAAKKSAGTAVKSPLPGVIVDQKVREGDQVKAGQHLLVRRPGRYHCRTEGEQRRLSAGGRHTFNDRIGLCWQK